MKNKKQISKFHAVKYMREQRDKISKDIADMSKQEIIEYFNKK